eukprot:9950990-Alexandrium_andersonii.AAC.1
MLSRKGRAQRRWVFGSEGCLSLALQLVASVPKGPWGDSPIIAAPETHVLQHFGGRARPASGLPRQRASAARRRGLGDPHPEAAH